MAFNCYQETTSILNDQVVRTEYFETYFRPGDRQEPDESEGYTKIVELKIMGIDCTEIFSGQTFEGEEDAAVSVENWVKELIKKEVEKCK